MIKKEVLFVAAAIMLAVFSTACGDNNDSSQVSSTLTDTEAVTTVEDTNKDITSIDPFEGLTVTFNGESGSGTVSLEYTGDNDFIRDKVRFNCDSPNSDKLSNGDVISVSARCTPKEQQENGYELSITEKEYTVSELGGFIDSPDGYDFSEIDSLIENAFIEGEWTKKCSNGNLINDLSESVPMDWQINDSSYAIYAKKLYIKKDNPVPNCYYLFYKLDFDCEKIDSVYVDNPDSEYEYGDTTHWMGIATVKAASLYADNHSVTVKTKYENDIKANQIIYFCRDESEFNSKISEIMSDYEEKFDAVYDVE
ncbi:MAG: hypothetical protein ACI4SF_15590 [Oscillospiraceae bacterium]